MASEGRYKSRKSDKRRAHNQPGLGMCLRPDRSTKPCTDTIGEDEPSVSEKLQKLFDESALKECSGSILDLLTFTHRTIGELQPRSHASGALEASPAY